MNRWRMTLLSVVIVLLAASACQPKIVEKVVKETVVVEKRVTVEKEVTKLVEKVVTTTPVPTSTSTITPVVIVVEKVVTATDRPTATPTRTPTEKPRATLPSSVQVRIIIKGLTADGLECLSVLQEGIREGEPWIRNYPVKQPDDFYPLLPGGFALKGNLEGDCPWGSSNPVGFDPDHLEARWDKPELTLRFEPKPGKPGPTQEPAPWETDRPTPTREPPP